MIEPRSAPIGVFDSGVGGLTVVRALRQEIPKSDFTTSKNEFTLTCTSGAEGAMDAFSALPESPSMTPSGM